MAHMHRFGDVRAAEIDDDSLATSNLRRAQSPLFRESAGPLLKRVIGHSEIDETGTGDRHSGENWIAFQPRSNLLRNRPWIRLCLLRGWQSAVALKLREVGPI